MVVVGLMLGEFCMVELGLYNRRSMVGVGSLL